MARCLVLPGRVGNKLQFENLAHSTQNGWLSGGRLQWLCSKILLNVQSLLCHLVGIYLLNGHDSARDGIKRRWPNSFTEIIFMESIAMVVILGWLTLRASRCSRCGILLLRVLVWQQVYLFVDASTARNSNMESFKDPLPKLQKSTHSLCAGLCCLPFSAIIILPLPCHAGVRHVLQAHLLTATHNIVSGKSFRPTLGSLISLIRIFTPPLRAQISFLGGCAQWESIRYSLGRR